MLACAIAHEIGHLMGLKHGAYGIMKPNFEPRDIWAAAMAELHFTTEDARSLRAVTGSGVNLPRFGGR